MLFEPPFFNVLSCRLER